MSADMNCESFCQELFAEWGKTSSTLLTNKQFFWSRLDLNSRLSELEKEISLAYCMGGYVHGASNSILRLTSIQDRQLTYWNCVEIIEYFMIYIFFILILTSFAYQRWKHCRKLTFFLFFLEFFIYFLLFVVISSLIPFQARQHFKTD